MKEDEIIGWHDLFNGHDPRGTLGDGEGQGSLACCSPWSRKELDTTWQLNNNRNISLKHHPFFKVNNASKQP